jgi:hypothetical protein
MEWQKIAAGQLKAELQRLGLNYDQLQKKLAQAGIEDSAENINRKINRGTFSFVFFLQCAYVMGLKNLNLENLSLIFKNKVIK